MTKTTKRTTTKTTGAKKTSVKKTTGKKTPAKPAAKKSTARPTSSAKKPTAKKATTKSTTKASVKKAITAKKAAPKATAKPAAKAPVKSTVPESIRVMARAVEKALDMNKAKDVIAVDLSRKSALADYMVIASGTSSRQVAALARYAEEALVKAGAKRCRIEGLPQGDWVIVDSGDIVVHLFRPEVREFYQLERLWTDEPNDAATTSRRSLA